MEFIMGILIVAFRIFLALLLIAILAAFLMPPCSQE